MTDKIKERLKNYPTHESQRGYFGKQLYKEMAKDPNIFLLTGDLGYKLFDPHFEDFPERAFSCGASEQAMVGIAVGLAQEGKKPFVYTITSFFLRAAETISLYLAHEQCPVVLVGGGRDDDYKDDGVSHYGYEAQRFIKGLGVIATLYPASLKEAKESVTEALEENGPVFVSLKR